MSTLNIVKTNEDQMYNALAAIARELQWFHTPVDHNQIETRNDEIVKLVLNLSKSYFKTPDEEHLEENNLHSRYPKVDVIDKETQTNNSYRASFAKKEANVLCHIRSNYKLLQKLNSEKHILFKKLHMIINVIHLGYQEIKRVHRGAAANENSPALQLKKIISFCNQCHASIIKDKEKICRLQQENRFLTNKVNILEKRMENMRGELRNLRIKNLKLHKIKCANLDAFNEYISSNLNTKSSSFSNKNYKQSCILNITEESYNMKNHLSLVNNLLFDQNKMITNLKVLLNEINS